MKLDVGMYVGIRTTKDKRVCSGFITRIDEENDNFAVMYNGCRIHRETLSDGDSNHLITIIPLEEVVGISSTLATLEMVQARSYSIIIEYQIFRKENSDLVAALPELKALAEKLK